MIKLAHPEQIHDFQAARLKSEERGRRAELRRGTWGKIWANAMHSELRDRQGRNSSVTIRKIQSRTNKVNKSDISATTAINQFLVNLISDSCSAFGKHISEVFPTSRSDPPYSWPTFYVPKLGWWQHPVSWHFGKLCDGPFACALPMQPLCQTGEPSKHP